MPPNHSDRHEVPEKVREETVVETEENDTKNCKEAGYYIGDAVFGTFIVAPLVVNAWRGTWGIMELNSKMFPFVETYILGIIIHISFSIARSHLFSRSQNAWGEGRAGRWLWERFLCRVYSYIFILACIMHWRGGWGLFDGAINAMIPDVENPHRPVLIAALTLILYISTTCLRSSRNLLASPYFLCTDGKEDTYMYTTRFKKPSSKETALYILDCVFSVTVVGSLVVFVWRGSWALLDIFLYPGDTVKSCWTSLVVGYALVVLTFAAQAPMRWAVARSQGAPRLLLADFYHLISFIATVNVWRGVWGLMDIYFFPETPKLSNWCSHVISLALLIILNCSNSVLVRGVYIDAEEPAGDCVVFPCHYLRLYFHKERVKKRHKKNMVPTAKGTEEANVPLQMPEEKV